MNALSRYSRVALTLLALPLLMLAPVDPAGAQSASPDSTAEQLLACDRLPAAERMECINAIVDSLRGGEPEAPAAADAEAPAPAAPAPKAAPAEPKSVPDDRQAPARAKAASVVEEVDAPKASDIRDSYQSNSLAPQYRGIPIPYEAVIVDVTTHYDGRFSVTLDNGDVWRETQGTRVRTPRKGASVEVYEGSLGGIRMKIDGVPKAAWVRRIE